MNRIIAVSFFAIFLSPINAQEIRINAIPYTEYNFGGNRLNGSLTILGWSRDGKIIYEYSAYNLKGNYAQDGRFKYYEVFDLVKDEKLYPEFEQQTPDYFNEEDLDNKYIREDLLQVEQREPVPNFVENAFNRQWVTFLAGRYRDYNILPVVSSTVGQFPYVDSNSSNEYTIRAVNQRPAFNNSGVDMDIEIKQNFPPYYSKIVGKIFITPIIRSVTNVDWNLARSVEFFYVKSPFENRIAIIVTIPNVYNVSGDILYEFKILGCHLGIGFN
jgi:hypothetical protein